jgi:hypothetical protein
MTPIPDPERSMGATVPVFLVLTLLCWMLMLGSIAGWIGKAPVIGRETDRMISQAYSGAMALLVWIFLGAILLIASSKNVLPAELGFAGWFVLPLSGVAALVAIGVLYNPARHWPVVIPAVVPVLVAGYVLYLFFPSVQTIPVGTGGAAMFGIVLVLSIAIVPEAIRFAQTYLDDGSIEATPGPKLDAWMAKEREKRRQDGLEQLRKSDDETKLYELESLIRPDSPVLQEALEFMRHLPNRQADAILQLQAQSSFILHFLGDIDLQPTPELCSAARGYLHRAVQERQARPDASPSTFIGAEFTEGMNSIRWIAKNCGCKAELAEMEAYARAQQQDSPEVQKFLAELSAIQAEAKQ